MHAHNGCTAQNTKDARRPRRLHAFRDGQTKRRPDKAFAARTEQHGIVCPIIGNEFVHAPKNVHILLCRLAEADAGVEDEIVPCQSCRIRRCKGTREKIPHCVDDVSRVCRSVLIVHHDDGRMHLCRRMRHRPRLLGVLKPPYIIQEMRTCAQRRARRLRLERIHGNGHGACGQNGFEERQQPLRAKYAAGRRRRCLCTVCSCAAHHHAELLRIENDKHAFRPKSALDLTRDVTCQPFLQLRTARHRRDQPCKYAKARHAARMGLVDDVRRAEERQQMMLTHRIKRNGAYGNEAVRLLRQDIRPKFRRIFMQPRKELRIELCGTLRRLLHPLRRSVYAKCCEKFTHGAYGARKIRRVLCLHLRPPVSCRPLPTPQSTPYRAASYGSSRR